MKLLRTFRFNHFITHVIIAVLYPIYAWVSSGKSLLKLIDALTITALVFLVVGIVTSMIRHGDFDITEYIARRTVHRGNMKPFKAFKEDKKENRKDSFNYPLCVCVLLFRAAGILTAFVY